MIELSNKGTLTKTGHIFTVHTGEFLTLACLKVFYLLAELRPFYATPYNLYCEFYVIALYLLCFKNIAKNKGLLISFESIFMNILLVSMTYTDWDGRFFAPLLPCFAMISFDPRKTEIDEKN